MSAQQTSGRVSVSFGQALKMLGPYAQSKIVDQIKTVSLIVAYLVLFQLIVLSIPISNALIVALGIGVVVLGLAFFMEGLFFGLMPLGEICGIRLPQKTVLPVILMFAFILGLGATFAEPAIGVLKWPDPPFERGMRRCSFSYSTNTRMRSCGQSALALASPCSLACYVFFTAGR